MIARLGATDGVSFARHLAVLTRLLRIGRACSAMFWYGLLDAKSLLQRR